MWKLLERLTDQQVRGAMGLKFEAFVDEAFQVIRWCGMVAVVDYMARRYPTSWFRWLYWVLAALLFGYIASRFLLRPEIRLFPDGSTMGQRIVQSGINFIICVLLFALVLWSVGAIIEGISEDRLAK